MTKVVLATDHFYNCPICGQKCREEEERGHNTVLRSAKKVQIFLCYNPLVTDPLHYYSHLVDKSAPNSIAYQEFSVNLGSKHIVFANDFQRQKAIIKNSSDSQPLELDFVIVPDFPFLVSLKKKVRTAITFS